MSKTKIILTGLILLAMGIFASSYSAKAASCSGEVLKFFPESKITSVIGSIRSASGSGSEINSGCSFYIQTPPGGSGSVRVTKYPSAAQAKTRFQFEAHGSKMGIGDDSSFHSGGDSHVLKNEYIFSVYWYCFCAEKIFLSEDQVRDILSYAVSQVRETPKPTPVPTPIPKSPTIISITPDTVPAGMKTGFSKQTGTVLYADAEIKSFKITGSNMQGAKLSVPKDLYGRPLARFVGIQVSPDGTTLTAWMYVSMDATAGKKKITLTNSANLSASGQINITVTGTQYLKRKFKDKKINFHGDWPETVPNSEVTEIEKGINLGLQAIDKSIYQKLGLSLYIYSKEYWLDYAMKRYCSNNNFGCSRGGFTSSIHISTGFGKKIDLGDDALEFNEMAKSDTTGARFVGSEILHEAAHKLDYYYSGLYFVKWLDSFKNRNLNVRKEWVKAVGDTGNCKYLPLTNGRWNNGNSRIPYCGFARAYGAVGIPEDIATMTAEKYFYPEIFKRGDGPTDPRYKQKEAILRKYGFL